MAELGFREDAPESVKESFLKHLIKNATGADVQTPSEKKAPVKTGKNLISASETKKNLTEPEQLCFEFYKENIKKVS